MNATLEDKINNIEDWFNIFLTKEGNRRNVVINKSVLKKIGFNGEMPPVLHEEQDRAFEYKKKILIL